MKKHWVGLLAFLCAWSVLIQTPAYADSALKEWDCYSFENNSSAFFREGENQNYQLEEQELEQLKHNLKALYGEKGDSLFTFVKEMSQEEWVGACFGIVATEGLFNQGLENFGLSSLSTAPAPKNNASLRSKINYYFLMQLLPCFDFDLHWGCKIVDGTIDPSIPVDWTMDIEALAKEVDKNPVLFAYQFLHATPQGITLSGHALILESVEKQSNGMLLFTARDNRFPGKNGTGKTSLLGDLNGNGSLVLKYPAPFKGEEQIIGFGYLSDFSSFSKLMPLKGSTDGREAAKEEVQQVSVHSDVNWSLSVGDSYLEKTADRIPVDVGEVRLSKVVGMCGVSETGELLYPPAILTYEIPDDHTVEFTTLSTDNKMSVEGEESVHVAYISGEEYASVSADYAAGVTLYPDGSATAEDIKGEVCITASGSSGDVIAVTAQGDGELFDDFAVTPTGKGAEVSAPPGELLVLTEEPGGDVSTQKIQVSPSTPMIVVN